MTFAVEIFSTSEWSTRSAAAVGRALPRQGSVVLTGGDAAARLFPALAKVEHDWTETDVLFSDERCVPSDDPASNFKQAKDLLLSIRPPRNTYRVRGEDPPEVGATAYSRAITPLMERGPDVMLLGLGTDAHIAALFPSSPVLSDRGQEWARAVSRPDGLNGVTLTPRALLRAKKIFVIVTGPGKADAVRRAVRGAEEPGRCPARLLADHADATFLLDAEAASWL